MFIARQPIFNKILKVYGYELLFRVDIDAKTFGRHDSTKATAMVLGGLYENGIKNIAGNTRAFVNFDYDFILSETIELIHPDELVIEVLEGVQADDILFNRLKDLKRKGYTIALDDFVDEYATYPLVPIADIIKYDIIATPLDDIYVDVRQALAENKILLAEKIETQEEFIKAKDMGFTLFQGYYFSRPKIIGRPSNKRTMEFQYTRIIDELKKEEPSYDNLVELFATNPNLAYRLIRITSNRNHKDVIDSIRSALVYMGFKEIERWVYILMLQELSNDKPEELIKTALVRSKFGEFIAEKSIYKKKKSEISMMCLFSNIDVLMDQNMEDALGEISITQDVKEALVHGEGIFKPICELIAFYEKGKWEKVEVISSEIDIEFKSLYHMYIKSLKWTDDVVARF